MFERFERAVSLGAACWKVLLLDKEMLIFPILSTLALGLIFGGSFYFLWSSGELQAWQHTMADTPHPEQDPTFLSILFAFYFITYFVMIFFNAGLLASAMIRFAGGDPTVMDGLSCSLRSLPQIFAWALVSATVGFLLAMLEDRFKGIGKFFIGLLGAGWAVATYFAVPVLVVDRVGPIEAVTRSVSAVRKTWGEALIGHIGLGALNIAGVLLAAPFILLGWMTYEQDPVVGSAMIALGVIWMLFCALIVTTLSAILRAALYIYAVEGEMPVNFDSRLIRNAFQPK